MKTYAILRNAGLSAQKTRLVAKEIRGLPVAEAVDLLNFTPKKAAKVVKKVLESAIANAEHNKAMDIDELKISEVLVDEASSLKRFKARAKGRGNKIVKRHCHIKVEVSNT